MGRIGTRTTRVVGGAAAALLLSGAVAFTAPTAGATSSFASVPAGYLDLRMRTDSATGAVSGQVLRFGADGTQVGAPQTFSINKCEVSSNGALLQFGPSKGSVGIYDNGLGTKLKNSCSPAEGRTSAGETFTVTLGSAFTGTSFRMNAAELDIEGKFGASLVWTSSNPSIADSATLATSSDNGPDVGTRDNNLVKISSKLDLDPAHNFSSLTLSTPVGEFALDGGGDGVYPEANKNSATNPSSSYDSIFWLTKWPYAYDVSCKTTQPASASDLAPSDSSGPDSSVAEITYVRLANKNQEDCAPIGLNLQASDANAARPDEVFIDNTPTSADGITQNVRARVRIVWVVQINDPVTGAPKTQHDLDLEMSREVTFTDGDTPVPVANCLAVPASVYSEPNGGALNPNSVANITHPTGFPWCLMSDSRVVSGSTIIQTQYYSANGDPKFF